MFDFDATKLMIVGILALIVLGPNELPRVMRQLGQMMGKMRRMAGDFQGQFMDAMREAELEDIRKEVSKLGDEAKKIGEEASAAAKFDMPTLDPAAELRKAAEGAEATPAGALDEAAQIGEAPTRAPTLEEIAAQDEATFGPLDIPAPEPPPPVTSEQIAAALGEPAPEVAPSRLKSAPAGVALEPGEEISFRTPPKAASKTASAESGGA